MAGGIDRTNLVFLKYYKSYHRTDISAGRAVETKPTAHSSDTQQNTLFGHK